MIFLQLFLAHILTDFVFQTSKWVKQKQKKRSKSVFLYIHAFLAGFFSYLLLRAETPFGALFYSLSDSSNQCIQSLSSNLPKAIGLFELPRFESPKS